MASYIASARSNYFEVTNPKRFEKLCKKWHLTLTSMYTEDAECFVSNGIITPDIPNHKVLYGFICEWDAGGLPSYIYIDDPDNEEKEIELDFDNFIEELTPLIMPGYVVIMMEAGAENYRYMTGIAVALNSKGDTKTVCLSDIYEKAKSLGTTITDASY